MADIQPVKPDFLIVGAAKSGTTSLYEYLRQHPDVFMPDWKEPAFFAPPEAGGVQSEEEYLALFQNAGNAKAVGEASVAYLYTPEAPQRIRDFLGHEVKIIILLRNPVDMAYSNWGHQSREGFETLSFDKALEKEQERLLSPDFFRTTGTWAANLAYRGRAQYGVQLRRFYELFPPSQIKLFIYEEFFAPDLPQWKELCHFLGINEGFIPSSEIHNPAGTVRSRELQRFLRHPSILKNTLKACLPSAWRIQLRKKLESFNRKSKSLPPMSEQLRNRLQKEFDPDIRQTEQYLGRSLKNIWY